MASLAAIAAFITWGLGAFALAVSDFYIASLTVLGLVLFALGFVYFLVADSLWKLKVQGWWLGMIASAISAVSGAIWLSIASGLPFIPPEDVVPILLFILAIVLSVSLFAVRGQYGLSKPV